jgi:hypothetical protein
LIEIVNFYGAWREVPQRIELGDVQFGRYAANERTDGNTETALSIFGDAMLMDLLVDQSLSTTGQVVIQNFNWSMALEADATLRAAFYDNDFAGGWSVFNEGHFDLVGTGSDLSDHLDATDNTSDGAAPVIVEEELTGVAGTFDSLPYGALEADWPAETCEAYEVGGSHNSIPNTDYYTGNIYVAEQDVTLQAFSQHLGLIDPCDLYFYVHKADDDSGPWSLAWTGTLPSAAAEDQFYDSGSVGVDIEAGSYYSIGVVHDCTATEYYDIYIDVSPSFDDTGYALTGEDVGGYLTNLGYGYQSCDVGTGCEPTGALVSTNVNFQQMLFLTPDE